MEKKTLLAIKHTDSITGFKLRHVRSETEYFRPHDHDYYEIFLVLKGTATHAVNGELRSVRPGNLIFIRSRDVHDYKDYSKLGFEFLNLAFTKDIFSSVYDFLGCETEITMLLDSDTPPTVHLSEKDVERLHMKLATLLSENGDSPSLKRARVKRLISDIFDDYFIRMHGYTSDAPLWLKNAYELMKLPQNFIAGSSRFFELCEKSREHASRLLSAFYQITPSEYVNGLRLEYAAGLLRNSNLSAEEICYQSGFKNLSHFYSCFRSKFGVTPNKYRTS